VLGDGGPGVLPADEEEAKIVAGGMMAGRLGGDPEVMLRDVRFVIGDYVAVAILPPLGNGNVAPGLGAGMGRGRDVRAAEMGDQFGGGKMGGPRENGFGGGFRGRGRGGWVGGPDGPSRGGYGGGRGRDRW
jgi:histone deacetylase complex subunit SAP18